MPSNQQDKDHFDDTANNPKTWGLRGADLHMASKVLREKVDSVKFDPQNDIEGSLEIFTCAGLPFIAAMLQGYTIEVLLKQKWLLDGKKLSEDGKTSLPARGTHDLSAIADDVGFPLSEIEREVLGRLSLFVSSYGRYPVTKKWTDNPLKKDTNGILSRMNWSNEDHKIAEQIIENIKAKPKA